MLQKNALLSFHKRISFERFKICVTQTKRENWGSTASNGTTHLKAFRLAIGLKRFPKLSFVQ